MANETSSDRTQHDSLVGLPSVQPQIGNLSRQTIWRKVKEGKFPRPAKVDGRSLWSQREIDQWVADRLAERFEARTERPGGAK